MHLSILASANELTSMRSTYICTSIHCVGFLKAQIWFTEGGVADGQLDSDVKREETDLRIG